MSLQADRFIYDAIKNDERVKTLTAGRIYNTYRPEKDEQEDAVPYIIVTFDGLQNERVSKDDDYESDTDQVTVSVLCVATDKRGCLYDLTQSVRSAVASHIREHASDYEEHYGTSIEGYDLTANAVQYDSAKPCLFQTLTYRIETYTEE